jgi:hypothetical protein
VFKLPCSVTPSIARGSAPAPVLIEPSAIWHDPHRGACRGAGVTIRIDCDVAIQVSGNGSSATPPEYRLSFELLCAAYFHSAPLSERSLQIVIRACLSASMGIMQMFLSVFTGAGTACYDIPEKFDDSTQSPTADEHAKR